MPAGAAVAEVSVAEEAGGAVRRIAFDMGIGDQLAYPFVQNSVMVVMTMATIATPEPATTLVFQKQDAGTVSAPEPAVDLILQAN